ncbi:hypothetical protein CONCODRAFT_79747, partial [Conidiobolus coronatus NRRL 28638]
MHIEKRFIHSSTANSSTNADTIAIIISVAAAVVFTAVLVKFCFFSKPKDDFSDKGSIISKSESTGKMNLIRQSVVDRV